MNQAQHLHDLAIAILITGAAATVAAILIAVPTQPNRHTRQHHKIAPNRARNQQPKKDN